MQRHTRLPTANTFMEARTTRSLLLLLLLTSCCCPSCHAAKAGAKAGGGAVKDAMPRKKYAKVRVDNGTTIRQQRFYAKLKPRHQLLPSLLDLVNSLATPQKDIYEFGVFTGSRLVEFASVFQGFGNMFGFDSFIGFPDEVEGVFIPNTRWRKGGDNAQAALDGQNVTSIANFIRGRIAQASPAVAERTSFVPGYFNDSLTEKLVRRIPFQPALIVDLDCDLYISTVQALRWLLRHRLLVPSSIVRYDDWQAKSFNATWGKFGSLWGQALAHHEVTHEYGLEWRDLGRDTFQLVSIREANGWKARGRAGKG